jgi:hypothetical protein
MKWLEWLIQTLGQLVGIYFFIPDNHVVPVLRMKRYHRVEGPGIFWINPFFERTLPPVKTSLYVGEFIFREVMSKDNIAFSIQMTVLFTFKPDQALKDAAAMLVQGGEELLKTIVKEYTDTALRCLASRFNAEALGHEAARLTIQRILVPLLASEMRTLGIAPLREGGVLLKQVVPPDKFKWAMLIAQRLETLLRTLAPFPARQLIEQVLQAEFVTGLEQLEGNLTFLSTFSPLQQEGIYSPYLLDAQQIPVRRGQKAQNGHERG